MKYASEDLINEHDGILIGLRILEKMSDLLGKNVKLNIDDLKEMVGFLQLFADKCHHGKEEGILFPHMEKAGIPRENGPIGQMLIEHAEGRKLLARMLDSMQTPFQSANFQAAATAYVDLLRKHIGKENKILFPLGDKKIPKKLQAEIIESFEAHERKVMGTGTHERLHRTLADFKQKYLSE